MPQKIDIKTIILGVIEIIKSIDFSKKGELIGFRKKTKDALSEIAQVNLLQQEKIEELDKRLGYLEKLLVNKDTGEPIIKSTEQ